MRIREYTSADYEALRRMHAAQGFGYPLPDLDSPLFVSKLVLEDGADELDAAGGANERDYADAEDEMNSASVGAASCESCGVKMNGERGREAMHRDSLPQRPSSARPQRVAMAVLLRLTAEAYLLHDPAAGTPRLRWQRFLALHEAARSSAAARGLDDVQAFLPPRVGRAFGRRLSRLGWTRDPWTCFSRKS